MIMTSDEIEQAVDELQNSTSLKRRNLRKRLIERSNKFVEREIRELQRQIRAKRALGAKDGDLMGDFSRVTDLEMRLII